MNLYKSNNIITHNINFTHRKMYDDFSTRYTVICISWKNKRTKNVTRTYFFQNSWKNRNKIKNNIDSVLIKLKFKTNELECITMSN